MKKILKTIWKFIKKVAATTQDSKVKSEALEAYLDLKARSRYGIH